MLSTSPKPQSGEDRPSDLFQSADTGFRGWRQVSSLLAPFAVDTHNRVVPALHPLLDLRSVIASRLCDEVHAGPRIHVALTFTLRADEFVGLHAPHRRG